MIRALPLLLLLLLAGPAPGQDEDGLWRLWNFQVAGTNEPAVCAKACAAFAAAHTNSPLATVARSMEAWNLLRVEKRDEASALLAPQIEAESQGVGVGAARLARAWLTRLDRERVRTALQFFYRKKVRYPYSLTELRSEPRLPAALLPPERDRWDEAWRYKLVGFKTMPGLEDQKYELQSATLGAASDLAAALAVPYGERIAIRPLRVRTVAVAGREVVEFSQDGGGGAPLLLTAGQPAEGLLLAHFGPRLLIVCDHFHWKLFPRPEGP